jgi:hypothetical protein
MFFLRVLYRYRYRRHEPGVRLQLGFLYEAYQESSWWFELVFITHIPKLLSFLRN